ncbi:hypothetical protein NPA30_12125 [Aurantimonas sp. CSK15Z-1]|nr:hypothetical protein [Aurantimonas sp. CSK15Z-1]MCQ8782925.1 hypothetical protein [Aurantimonas sp. CSK15Z-1]
MTGSVLAIGLAIPGAAEAAPPAGLPDWLRPHVGDGDGQIAPIILQRAQALYRSKVASGIVKNPCYFAMDATRPSDLGNGRIGERFYMICEADQSFRAFSAGHGSGRNLSGIVDVSNGRECAKNFGNARDALLTTGGSYVTAEARASFKGYYRSSGQIVAFSRPFVQFDGEGDTANARTRAIGGHPAQVLRGLCRRRDAASPHADAKGYVTFGTLVDYAAGRSNGCTSWSAADAARIIPVMQNDPTTLYIYPEARDIEAVAAAAQAGRSPASAGTYWNPTCLQQIGRPRFWPAATLEPLIARYKAAHPAPPPEPLPICK